MASYDEDSFEFKKITIYMKEKKHFDRLKTWVGQTTDKIIVIWKIIVPKIVKELKIFQMK